MWFDFKNSPVKALREMVSDPVNFNAMSFIDRTFKGEKRDTPDLRALASIYDTEGAYIKEQLSHIAYGLTSVSRPSIDNRSDQPICITYRGKHSERCREKVIFSNNLQIDRMLDWFDIRSIGSAVKNSDDVNRCISFFALNEAIFMVFCGIAKVAMSNDGFQITIADERSRKALHRKWFANFWDLPSSKSAVSLIDSVRTKDTESIIFYEDILYRSLKLRDRYFSIPLIELPSDLNKTEHIQWINKLCNITTLLFWCTFKGEMKYVSPRMLERFFVTSGDLKSLELALKDLSEPDRYLSIDGNGVCLIKPDIQPRKVIQNLAEILSGSRDSYNQLIGDFFENSYLKKYFKTGIQECSDYYKIHENGIEMHEVIGLDRKEKLDIDFIIEDLRRNRFIFVQSKYVRIGGTAYIAGDLDHLSGSFWKGVKQIEGAKKAFESGMLDEILIKKGVVGATVENSIFAIIHNVSNFDFQLLESGVVSYEWNTFRNLIQDGRYFTGNSKNLPVAGNLGRSIPVENPDKTISLLMQYSPVVHQMGGKELFETDYVETIFQVQNKKVTCLGLGL